MFSVPGTRSCSCCAQWCGLGWVRGWGSGHLVVVPAHPVPPRRCFRVVPSSSVGSPVAGPLRSGRSTSATSVPAASHAAPPPGSRTPRTPRTRWVPPGTRPCGVPGDLGTRCWGLSLMVGEEVEQGELLGVNSCPGAPWVLRGSLLPVRFGGGGAKSFALRPAEILLVDLQPQGSKRRGLHEGPASSASLEQAPH